MTEDVTITYLEMTDAGQLRAKDCPDPQVSAAECSPMQWPLARLLYTWVGGGWQWHERLSWTDDQWTEFAADTNVRMWVAYRQGSIAGYFELNKQDGDVEIKYFGLTPEFIGTGLGGYLLSEAIGRAWQWNANRVWVHTCTLDHENAAANYKARGMTVYKEETKVK